LLQSGFDFPGFEVTVLFEALPAEFEPPPAEEAIVELELLVAEYEPL
jgi:hypothetical protein